MLANEENIDDQKCLADLITRLKPEQLYVGPACKPQTDYLREYHSPFYNKF